MHHSQQVLNAGAQQGFPQQYSTLLSHLWFFPTHGWCRIQEERPIPPHLQPHPRQLLHELCSFLPAHSSPPSPCQELVSLLFCIAFLGSRHTRRILSLAFSFIWGMYLKRCFCSKWMSWFIQKCSFCFWISRAVYAHGVHKTVILVLTLMLMNKI